MTRTQRKTGGDGRGKIRNEKQKKRRKEGRNEEGRNKGKRKNSFQWQSSKGEKQGSLFSLEVEPYLCKFGSAETI